MNEDEEKEQLRYEVRMLKERIRVLEEHMESYERDNSIPSTSTNSQEVERLLAEIAGLRTLHGTQEEEIQNLLLQTRNLEKYNQDLVRQNKEYVELLKEDEVSDHESSQLQLEIRDYKKIIESLEDEKKAYLDKLLEFKQILAMKESQLQEEMIENERAIGESQDLKEQVRVLKNENEELELRISQVTDLPHAGRGNSMFGEFADERRNLEKDLQKLHTEMIALRRENKALKVELEDSKLRTNTIFAKGRGEECKCKEVEVELQEVRSHLESSEQRLIAYLRTNLQHLTVPEKVRFFSIEIEKFEQLLAGLRKERDEARDILKIEQVKVRNGIMDINTYKAKIDELEKHLSEQRCRIEELMLDGASDKVTNLNTITNVPNETPTRGLMPPNVPEMTPAGISTLKTTFKSESGSKPSLLLVDHNETRAKAEQRLESERLANAAMAFRNRLHNNKKQNSFINASTPGPDEKKPKFAVAPRPLYSNFKTIVLDTTPKKDAAKENVES